MPSMDVTYFSPTPLRSAADRVQSNHMDYFRARGWNIHLIVPRGPALQHFRARQPWIQRISEVDLPACAWSFRDLLYAYSELSSSAGWRAALRAPGDVFFTHYAFTAPLAEHLPACCKTVLVSLERMTERFEEVSGP